MALRMIRLSDTQARVIGGAVIMGDTITVCNVGRSTRATFRKLFDLGLTDQPWAGSRLTLEGMNIRTSLHTDLLQRAFSIAVEISRNAYVIQPIAEAYCAMHDKGISGCVDQHPDTDGGFAETVNEPVEWHIFNGEEWMVISYSGYAPVNHWDGEKWHEVKYRHRMHMCNAECTPVVVPETYALTVIRISGEEHIHRTGCGDIKRSKARAGIWAGDPWDIPVTSLREYTEIYWGDICTDQGPEGSPEYLRELYSLRNYGKWHACVPKLPEGDWSDVPA